MTNPFESRVGKLLWAGALCGPILAAVGFMCALIAPSPLAPLSFGDAALLARALAIGGWLLCLACCFFISRMVADFFERNRRSLEAKGFTKHGVMGIYLRIAFGASLLAVAAVMASVA